MKAVCQEDHTVLDWTLVTLDPATGAILSSLHLDVQAFRVFVLDVEFRKSDGALLSVGMGTFPLLDPRTSCCLTSKSG